MTTSPRPRAVAASTGTTTARRVPDWAELSRVADAPVLLPGGEGFVRACELFNRRYAGRRPAAVVRPGGPDGVRAAVRWARAHDVPLVARAGGHSFAGYSVNDGLVVDLGRLDGARTDPAAGSVTVGGGTRVAGLYDALRPHRLVVPTGTSPLVGVAGLALGGGCAYASRRLGLTLDSLVSTEVVTADGESVIADEHRNADLFWACRGGGGGNFGIHVSFTFRAQPVPDVTTFDLTWRPDDAVAVLTAGQAVLQQAPDDFSVRFGISTHGADPSRSAGNALVTASGQYFGPAGETEALLAPLLRTARPVRQHVTERTYWAANEVLGHATAADAFALRSRFAVEPIPPEGLERALSWVRRWPGSSSTDGGGIGLFAWGGRINAVAPDATAFVHRGTLLLASMDTAWTAADDPDRVARNLEWLAGFHADMGRYLTDSAYQNFPDPELDDWAGAYYGGNYPRLCRVKAHWDPDGLFTFDQAIGTALGTPTGDHPTHLIT